MPWEIHKKGSQFCVYKKGASTPIKGGCHSSREDALKHLRALYVNVPEARMSENVLVSVMAFSEEGNVVWLEAMPAKTWHTMEYGEVPMPVEKLQRMVDNFKRNVRGQDIATNFEHGMDRAKGNKASGWFRDFKIAPSGNDPNTMSLHAAVEFTEEAKRELADKQWRYFSLEWDDYWQHPETQEPFEDVIVGGALTNRPVAKGLVPINFSEIFEERKEFATVADMVVEATVPELELAEPGTQVNPADDLAGDRSGGADGRRIDTPPAGEDGTVPDRSDTVTTPHGEGREMDTLDAQLREALGLADDADIIKAVSDLRDTAQPLKEAVDEANAVKAFSELYPEQAAELEELRKERIETSAKAFSESCGKLRFKVGKTQTEKGLSGLALEKIEETHKKFSEGSASLADFEDVLKTITGDDGIVDFGETGSSGSSDLVLMSSDPRIAFSELVKKIQEESDEPLEYSDAVREAANRDPELAKAYQNHRPAA